MVEGLLSFVVAATPVLVDAPPARAVEVLASVTSDDTFVDFDDSLRATGISGAALDAELARLPPLLRTLELEHLEQRLAALERELTAADSRRTMRGWLEVWFVRGFSKFLQNESQPLAGVEEAGWALAIDPALTVELPKAERFAKWVAAQRERAKQLPVVRHRITSGVPALVWVDGVFRGVAPLELMLTRGAHVVCASSPERERTQQLVKVDGASTTALAPAPALPSSRLATRAAVVESSRRGQPPSVELPVPEFVVLRESDGLRPVRVSAGEVAPALALVLPTATPAALAAALSTPSSSSSPSSTTVVQSPTPNKPLAPALLAFGGAGALAIGSALTFALGQSAFQRAASIPQLEVTSYEKTMSDGRGLTAVGATLAGLALAAAGVGVFFLFD